MPSSSANLTELLAIARDLVVRRDFDVEVVIELCNTLQREDLEVHLNIKTTHARLVAATALHPSTAHTTVARFALARLIVLLEKRIEPRLMSRS